MLPVIAMLRMGPDERPQLIMRNIRHCALAAIVLSLIGILALDGDVFRLSTAGLFFVIMVVAQNLSLIFVWALYLWVSRISAAAAAAAMSEGEGPRPPTKLVDRVVEGWFGNVVALDIIYVLASVTATVWTFMTAGHRLGLF